MSSAEPSTPPAAAALSAGRRRAFRAACALIAAAVGLLLAEGLVRVVAPQPLSGAWRTWSPGGYAAHRPLTTARHQFHDRVVTYRFDAIGLRGGGIDPSAVRVLCLGDSFTFGWLVDEPDTFVGRMQSAADARLGAGRVQFLNGGAGGWSTACELAFLEDRGDEIRPDAVVCFLNSWDIGRSRESGLYEFAPGSRTELVRRRPEPRIGAASRLLTRVPGYGWLLERSHLLQLLRNLAVRSAQPPARERPGAPSADAGPPGAGEVRAVPPRDDDARDLGRALFLRMKAWCDARSAPLWVVTTGRPETLPPDGRGTPSGHMEATLAFKADAETFFRDAGVPYADLAPQVSDACGGDFLRLQIPGDGHPDEEGCRVIGRFAWEAIGPRVVQLVGSRPR